MLSPIRIFGYEVYQQKQYQDQGSDFHNVLLERADREGCRHVILRADIRNLGPIAIAAVFDNLCESHSGHAIFKVPSLRLRRALPYDLPITLFHRVLLFRASSVPH
jgi:hypothetical protein